MLNAIPHWIFDAAYLLGGSILVAAEILAVVRPAKGDTISEHGWAWQKGKPLRRMLLSVFLLWLLLHFALDGALG